jgi:uncharacterized membrane protein required for colicin V production
VDLAIAAALLAFVAWGAFHGALRQLLGLLVLTIAFLVAPWISPRLEGSVRKLVDLGAEDVSILSWGLAFVMVAAAGGVVLHSVRGPVSRARAGGALDRVLGGLVGALKGLVVVGLVAYAALVWFHRTDAPGVVTALRESRFARLLVGAHRRLEPALRLPEPVERRLEEVDRRIVDVDRRIVDVDRRIVDVDRRIVVEPAS